MLISIKRIFRSGWQIFTRDKEVSLATVFILFLAISLVSSLFLFIDLTKLIITTTQEKIDISVYFKEEADEDDILGIGKEISKFSEVKAVEYVSPEQALVEFIARHEKDPLLIEAVEEVGRNPFLASLTIKAWDPSQYGVVSNFLQTADFQDLIEKIDYFERKSVIEKISSFSSSATKIGVLLSVVLIIIAVLVVFNTIRLSIYNSSEEIKIQRLVGASNLSIRGPFLVQGVISGLIATFICFLLFALLSWSLNSSTESFFYGFSLFNMFISNFWALLFLQLITGISLGTLSSSIAIRRYLKT